MKDDAMPDETHWKRATEAARELRQALDKDLENIDPNSLRTMEGIEDARRRQDRVITMFLAEALEAYGRECAERMRERAAQCADDFGEGDGEGIAAATFDEKYGNPVSLAAAIRSLPLGEE